MAQAKLYPKHSRVSLKVRSLVGTDDDDKNIEIPGDAIGTVMDDSMKGTRLVHFTVNGRWASAHVLISLLKEAVDEKTQSIPARG